MYKLALALAVTIGLSLTAASAFAAPVTWTIPNTPMSQGGAVSGSFVYDASLPVSERLVSINVTESGSTPTNYQFVSFSYNTGVYGQNVAVATPSDRVIYISTSNIPSIAGGTYQATIYANTCAAIENGKCNGLIMANYASNVVLTSSAPAAIPTLSEWAMILLGIVLAGGAALTLQRRRVAA